MTRGFTITQWTFQSETCNCDFIQSSIESQKETQVQICSSCGKRVPKNIGSLTQWIFGQGNCECDRPMPVATPVEKFIAPGFAGFKSKKDEEEIDVDPKNFPTARYKAIAKLGRGASGEVYLCRDRLLGHKVAVKILLDLSAQQLVSFQDEAKATAKLNHKNIVKILDFGVPDGGTPYMVMNYVPGISLRKYLEKYGTLDDATARKIFSQLALALQYAHDQGIFHRDLKPNNIILYEVDENIEVCLIDFGIAKFKQYEGMGTSAQSIELAGTPAYMSPDPFKGDSFDSRSEIYCFGCVIYEALTGKPPFEGKTAIEILSQHATKPAAQMSSLNPEIKDDIERIVLKCLEKGKQERYVSMKDVHQALTTESDLVASDEQTPKTSRSNSVNFITVLIAIFIPVTVGIIYSLNLISTNQSKTKTAPQKNNYKKKSSSNSSLKKGLNQPKISKSKSGYGDPLKSNKINNRSIEQKVNSNRQSLEFVDRDLTGDALEPLTRKSFLSLNLVDCKLDKSSFTYIGDLHRLDSLKFVNCKESIKDLVEMKNAKRLRSLTLAESRLTPKDVRLLSNLTRLNYLSFEDCKLSSQELVELRNLKSLQKLELVRIGLDKKAVETIASLPTIKSITMIDSYRDDKVKSDHSNYFDFTALNRLHDLSLVTKTKAFTAEKLKVVGELKSLKYLLLNLNSASSKIFPDIKKLNKLESAVLMYADVEKICTRKLAASSYINTVIFMNCNFKSNDSIKELIKSKSINSLAFTGCNITDEILLPCAKMRSLKELLISSCRQVTPAFKMKFKAQNKKCKLEMGQGDFQL